MGRGLGGEEEGETVVGMGCLREKYRKRKKKGKKWKVTNTTVIVATTVTSTATHGHRDSVFWPVCGKAVYNGRSMWERRTVH